MNVEIKLSGITVNTLARMQIIFGNRLKIVNFSENTQLFDVIFISEFPDDNEPSLDEMFGLVIRVVNEVNIKTLNCSVDNIGLLSHTVNCLKRADINTVKDLIGQTERDLVRIMGVSSSTIEDIRKVLAKVGFTLKG
ncbi:MAG TPA: hypothetical protein DDY52_02690 [Candidatus Moranbacteria bacterium]|nr:MAG: DNA-directed RNA polymerase subunit alpha [Candidatus Moranbacteria bacterium GW2011_GWF1_34_10]HBI17033.1 hypothetical protein [Candidatus Moranbacteria bacterium]